MDQRASSPFATELSAWCAVDPSAPALAALGGSRLNRGQLCALLAAGRSNLRHAGIDPGDRVVVVVPQGLDGAVTLLQAAISCDVVPLQPARGAAWASRLSALGPAAMITPAGCCPDAEAAADELGIRRIDPARLREPASPMPPAAWARPGVPGLIVATSGTTGPPKWVRLDPQAVLAGCRATAHALELSERDSLLLPLPLNHTHGIVTGLLTPLLSGGAVVIAPRFDPTEVLTGIQDSGVTWLTLPPAMHRALLEQHAITPVGDHRLRFLRSGSAGMPIQLAQAITAAFGVPLIDAYGMSECPHIACNPLSAQRIGSVGLPLVAELAIVDDAGVQRPAGEWGQVKVRGAPTMRGYLSATQPPVDPVDDEGWLNTGDEGKLDDDGYLYLRGRRDDAINRGGLKLMPAEVDAALVAHPAVREAVVFGVPHPSLGRDLVAAVVPEPDSEVDQAELNSSLAACLPRHMIPSRIVLVQRIPVEPGGKVARRRLPELLSSVLAVEDEPPQGPTEQLLVDLFDEVITGRAPSGWRAGRFTNFFLEGGDSLAAMRLLSRLAARGWVDIPPALLFERPTPAELAVALGRPESSAPAGAPPDGADVDRFPASPAQSALWFLHQVNPGLTAYHLPQLWKLNGEIDIRALTAALQSLIERHATLRTSFRLSDGELLQTVNPASVVVLRTEDLHGRDPDDVIADWQRREAVDPFDLTIGPLLRARLLRIGPREHVLLLNHHHIASDGWSEAVLARDLGTLYNATRSGTEPQLCSVPVRYVDYALRKRERLSGDRLDRLRSYWSAQLSGLAPLRLPANRRAASPDPASLTGDGASVSFAIDHSTSARLETLCRAEGATMQMALVAALVVLLHRETGQDDLAVGVPAWGRDHPDVENLVGLFVNTLPIRVGVADGMTYRSILRSVRAVSLAAYAHQELPFGEIMKDYGAESYPDRSSAIRAVIQLVDDEFTAPLEFDGVTAEDIERADLSTRFDLEFLMQRVSNGGLTGRLTFSRAIFETDHADRLVRGFREVIDSFAEQSDCPVGPFGPAPSPLPPEQWGYGPELTVPDLCVHRLFSMWVAENPDACAVVDGDRKLRYAELDAQANRLAHRLIEEGVGPDSIVAVCLTRSVEMVVAVLAVLKAGGAYFPLDPEWPSDRKALALCAVGPRRWLVTSADPAGDWAAGAIVIDPTGSARDCSQTPDSSGHTTRQLAYVNFTSGSSGEPKGVLIEHRGVLRLLQPDAGWAMKPGDRMLQLAPLAFDASTLEMWLPLLSGATLVLAPPGPVDLEAIAALVVRQRISILWLTAGLFHAMVESQRGVLAGVRRILAGGDVLDPSAVQTLINAMPGHHLLINGYGPTESTTFATTHTMAGGSTLPARTPVPIGRPLAGTTLRVLDSGGTACAVGVPGELYIGGDGLARGYLNDTRATAAHFVTDPGGSGERLYRTGDLTSWQPDGTLIFHGRIDEQVKIRGYRVHPAEVAAALSGHPAVTGAVAVPVTVGAAGPVIVAYWVGRGDTAATQLREFLSGRLPEAMIPSSFVRVERFPLTLNGKVDRAALPPPFVEECTTRTAPSTPTERRLHALWADVLGHSGFGVTDNFFMAGGHSLQAVRLHARINDEFRSTFPVSLVIAAPTIRAQAQWLSGRVCTSTENLNIVTIQPDGDRTPLFVVHGWGGTLYHFVDMARALAPHRPVFGLQPAGFEGMAARRGVESMARAYAESIIERVPEGPINLAGHSAGGWYAYAVAAALIERGRTIGLLAVFDSQAGGVNVHWWLRLRLLPFQWPAVAEKLNRISHPPDGSSRAAWIRRRLGVRIRRFAGRGGPEGGAEGYTDHYVNLVRHGFRPPRLPVSVDLFGPRGSMKRLRVTWRYYARGGMRIHPMLDDHQDFLRPERGPQLAGALERALAVIESSRNHNAESVSEGGLEPPRPLIGH